MLKGERREQKAIRNKAKAQRANNRKSLEVIIQARLNRLSRVMAARDPKI